MLLPLPMPRSDTSGSPSAPLQSGNAAIRIEGNRRPIIIPRAALLTLIASCNEAYLGHMVTSRPCSAHTTRKAAGSHHEMGHQRTTDGSLKAQSNLGKADDESPPVLPRDWKGAAAAFMLGAVASDRGGGIAGGLLSFAAASSSGFDCEEWSKATRASVNGQRPAPTLANTRICSATQATQPSMCPSTVALP